MSIQNKYPNCNIAYRLGDFYEVFGENAKILADKLDLTLTSRDCGLESRVPMVGFPYHIAEAYVTKALQHGLKIALAESLEDIKTYCNQPDGAKQTVDLETGEIIPQKAEADEPIPTVSNLLSDYTEEVKANEQLEKEISAVIEDEFDVNNFNASALALLYIPAAGIPCKGRFGKICRQQTHFKKDRAGQAFPQMADGKPRRTDT